MVTAEVLLQPLQEQSNYDGPKNYRKFQVQVIIPTTLTLCDLLTTNSALTSFTWYSTLQLIETVVEAVSATIWIRGVID